MATTITTKNLNLSNWIGSDIPKREDFNLDNQIIDEVCGNHIYDKNIHVTQEEKERWSNVFEVGTYFGTGASEKAISVDFKPRMVIIFSDNKPLGMVGSSDCYFAIATEHISSLGANLTSTGFKAYYGSPHISDGVNPKLNEVGVDYCYIAFK